MRAVLYADQDMEPITVIEVPAEFMSRLRNGEKISFPIVSFEATEALYQDHTQPIRKTFDTVTVWVEKFTRKGLWTAMLFTNDEKLALCMKSEFLPGQNAEVQRQRVDQYRRGFVTGLLRATGL